MPALRSQTPYVFAVSGVHTKQKSVYCNVAGESAKKTSKKSCYDDIILFIFHIKNPEISNKCCWYETCDMDMTGFAPWAFVGR